MSFTDDEVRKAKTECDLAALFVEDGCAIERSGGRTKVCCPFHADRTPSCEIYAADQSYYCFGCKAHGDAISYLREKRGLRFDQAMAVLGAAPKVAMPAKPDRRRKWQVEMPAPAKAGLPRCQHYKDGKSLPATKVWPYYDAERRVLMADARYDYTVEIEQDGQKVKVSKKDVITWSWARNLQGESTWRPTRAARCPLYGLDRLAQKPDATVLLVEGCKAADAGAERFPEFAVLSWCGGVGNAEKPDHNDWSPLAGRDVILWPDADWVGANAMQHIAKHMAAVGAKAVQVVDLTPSTAEIDKKGWDVADGDEAKCRRILAAGLGETAAALARMLDAFPAPETAKPKPAADDQADDSDDADDADPPDDQADDDQADDDADRNEIELATQFLKDHGGDVRYLNIDEKNSVWLVWDERRWKRDYDGEIIRRSEATMRRLTREYEARARELFKTAKEDPKRAQRLRLRKEAARWISRASQIQSKATIQSMLFFARSRPGVPIRPIELDADPRLLNTLSGTFDRDTGNLHKPRREDLISKLAPVEYNPKADRTDLLRVLKSVTSGDKDVARYLADMLGSSILWGNRFEKVHFLVGPGGSGKGTLFEAIKMSLGDYAATSDPQTFAKVQSTRIRSDIIRLQGARLVIASESDRSDVLDTQVLKLLSGNDTMTARWLYGKDEEFKPTFTIWFQCNSEPRIPDDTDSGVWRRWVEVPTGPIVPEDKVDPDLKVRLQDPTKGGQAILAWLIEGGLRVGKAARIEQPEAVQVATAKYRLDSDPLASFLADNCRFGPIRETVLLDGEEHTRETYCLGTDLYKAYINHSNIELVDRRHHLSGKGIGKRLRALGCTSELRNVSIDGNTKQAKCWCGITLFDAGEHAAKGFSYVPSQEEHDARVKTSKPQNLLSGKSRTRDENKCSEMPTQSQSISESLPRGTSQTIGFEVLRFEENKENKENKKELENKEEGQNDQPPPTDPGTTVPDLGDL